MSAGASRQPIGNEPDPAGHLAAYRGWLHATAGVAASTAINYTGHVGGYLRWLAAQSPAVPLADTQRTHVEGYLGALAARGCSGSTRRTALHALRSFYRWQLGDQAGRSPAALTRRPRARPPLTVPYTETDADQILTAARTPAAAGGPASARGALRAGLDPAVLAVLRWTGLRAAELCTLPLTQLDLDRQLLRVVGKGTKPRVVPLPDTLTEQLDQYLRDVRPGLPDSPLLFTNPDGQQAGQALTGRALLDLCRRHGTAAGIAGPHTAVRWRHTFATLSLARGVDLYAVSRLLGHARVETTQRYLHLDTGQLSDAIRRAYPTVPQCG
jgi:site-specific recombinase XerD